MSRLALLAAGALIIVGCTTAGPSPSSTPTGSPNSAGFALRTSVSQSIPPAAAFEQLVPPLHIEDGIALVRAPQDAIFPPGHITILQQHTISDAGIRRIIDAAAAAGLLGGATDFAPDAAPGSKSAEIAFVVDGVERRITGDPDRQIVCVTTPCEAPPGTPEAFGGFWAQLADLNGLVGEELGPATAHAPDRLALLLTEPRIDAALPVEFADWPLEDVQMAEFGVALAGAPPSRCGLVEGEDVALVSDALQRANVYTRWRDGNGAELGIVARPLFPGEPSPCGPG